MQLGPVRSLPDDDDWKWTLRSVANRPILRSLTIPFPPKSRTTSSAEAFPSSLALPLADTEPVPT